MHLCDLMHWNSEMRQLDARFARRTTARTSDDGGLGMAATRMTAVSLGGHVITPSRVLKRNESGESINA